MLPGEPVGATHVKRQGTVAASRFIEIRSNEVWASVSRLFAHWLGDRASGDVGWSKGDPISLDDGRSLICFSIPDHHRTTIDLFQEWAESTDRLYGITDGGRVVFPRMPALTFLLPLPENSPIPPWLQ
ncbi:hypothetical protein H1235_06620 [Pseudoxanthomonas sp. NC8]|nr:hypothetical protein H1235_06620 [Pseudoxanthomonas sp. NC8]